MPTSSRTIERLCIYRRLLNAAKEDGKQNLYSHQLAALAGVSAAQVRRDIMAVGYNGSPNHGYDIDHLIRSLASFLDEPDIQSVALIGVGNLGRALLTYFSDRRPKLAIKAAFDMDPNKCDRVINGCRCFHMDYIENVLKEERIKLGIITVPADAAQNAADKLISNGVHGILNFAPARLRVAANVSVEYMDMTVALEKLAYFASRQPLLERT